MTNHDQLKAAYETYISENEKFTTKGVKAAAARARKALQEMSKGIKERRKEITAEKEALAAKWLRTRNSNHINTKKNHGPCLCPGNNASNWYKINLLALPNVLNFKEKTMFEATIQEPSYRTANEVNSAMLRVYNHMLMAIVTSAVVAGLVASSPAAMAFFFTGIMKWIILFLPLVAVFGVSYALANNPPHPVAVGLLHGFAGIMGISLGAIVHVYTTGSLVMAFASSAILFATMSFYGYFTKRSLESFGQFLIIGLVAIIIASIVNIFIGSSVMTMVISAIAIIIFLGLTAYDTQQIREMVSVNDPDVPAEILGALTLYLDFINIFVNLLQLFGTKNED